MGIKIKKNHQKNPSETYYSSCDRIYFSVICPVRQLFSLQIIQGEDYISKFQTRTTKTQRDKSTRGNIYDRTAQLSPPMYLHILSHSKIAVHTTAPEKRILTLNGIAYQVLQILSKNGDSLSDNFHITVNDHGDYAFDVDEGFTLNRFRADIYGEAQIDDLSEERKTQPQPRSWIILPEAADFLSFFTEKMPTPRKNLPHILFRKSLPNRKILRNCDSCAIS